MKRHNYNYVKNNIMRILIFGGNGWIGQQFVQIASTQNIVHRVAVSRVDLDHIVVLEEELDAFAPTHRISQPLIIWNNPENSLKMCATI